MNPNGLESKWWIRHTYLDNKHHFYTKLSKRLLKYIMKVTQPAVIEYWGNK